MSDWFKELFIDEAKTILNTRSGGISDERIDKAVEEYLDDNPVEPATVSIKDNVLVVE